jgi:DNA-binding MarR family transcriptional regulator
VNDPVDRRRRAVTLTARGRELTADALKVACEITAATLSPLSAEEQLQLARLLNRIA